MCDSPASRKYLILCRNIIFSSSFKEGTNYLYLSNLVLNLEPQKHSDVTLIHLFQWLLGNYCDINRASCTDNNRTVEATKDTLSCVNKMEIFIRNKGLIRILFKSCLRHTNTNKYKCVKGAKLRILLLGLGSSCK